VLAGIYPFRPPGPPAKQISIFTRSARSTRSRLRQAAVTVMGAGITGLNDGKLGQRPSRADRVDRADRVKIEIYSGGGRDDGRAVATPLMMILLFILILTYEKQTNADGISSSRMSNVEQNCWLVGAPASGLQLPCQTKFDFHPVRPVHPVPSQTRAYDWNECGNDAV